MIKGYKILDKIGSGTFSKVYKLEKDDKYYAGKIFINGGDACFSSDFLTEINILSKLEHSSIIKYHEIIIEKDTLWMIMNLYENSYDHNIKDYSFLYKLACGVQYLHYRGIIHRDIKPGNILLDGENPIICDFGNSITYKNEEELITDDEITTLNFKAPELWLNCYYNNKIDIWSLGVTFLHYFEIFDIEYIATDLMRFTGSCLELSYFQSIYKQEDIDKLIKKKFDRILADLLIGMLQIDPKKRLSANQVVEHLFFKNYQREPVIYKQIYYRYKSYEIEHIDILYKIPIDAQNTTIDIFNKYISLISIIPNKNILLNCVCLALTFHNYKSDDFIDNPEDHFEEQKEILEKIDYHICD